MEKQYAQALWKLVKRGMEPKKAVHALRDMLAREGRSELLPRVARAFQRIALEQSKKTDVVLTVATEGDITAAKKHTHDLIAEFGVTPHDVQTRIDGSLIGGWRLEGKEKLIDASYKRRLLDLFSRVTHA
jgi:F0F1-type ATP synthase delta subunit